jgi:hypothetical protein
MVFLSPLHSNGPNHTPPTGPGPATAQIEDDERIAKIQDFAEKSSIDHRKRSDSERVFVQFAERAEKPALGRRSIPLTGKTVRKWLKFSVSDQEDHFAAKPLEFVAKCFHAGFLKHPFQGVKPRIRA